MSGRKQVWNTLSGWVSQYNLKEGIYIMEYNFMWSSAEINTFVSKVKTKSSFNDTTAVQRSLDDHNRVTEQLMDHGWTRPYTTSSLVLF